MSNFPCSACGCCCKNADVAVERYKLLDPDFIFPYKIEDGVCSKLKDNKCIVYNRRPILCKVDRLAEKYNIELGWFYSANIDACNKMMDDNNIDLKFRIYKLNIVSNFDIRISNL